jgi:hypothetical protein
MIRKEVQEKKETDQKSKRRTRNPASQRKHGQINPIQVWKQEFQRECLSDQYQVDWCGQEREQRRLPDFREWNPG